MEDIEKLIGEYQNVDLITLLRTFKKEGLENFIVIRKNKLENLIKRYRELEETIKIMEHNYKVAISETIHKSKIQENLEELREEYKIALEENSIKAFILKCQIEILEKLLEEK